MTEKQIKTYLEKANELDERVKKLNERKIKFIQLLLEELNRESDESVHDFSQYDESGLLDYYIDASFTVYDEYDCPKEFLALGITRDGYLVENEDGDFNSMEDYDAVLEYSYKDISDENLTPMIKILSNIVINLKQQKQ